MKYPLTCSVGTPFKLTKELQKKPITYGIYVEMCVNILASPQLFWIRPENGIRTRFRWKNWIRTTGVPGPRCAGPLSICRHTKQNSVWPNFLENTTITLQNTGQGQKDTKEHAHLIKGLIRLPYAHVKWKR